MGLMENRFKSMFIDPPVFLFQAVIGVFRMPAIAIKDYKYNHDPKYREKVDLTDDVEYKAQKERIKSIKSELNNYIQEDLKREPQSVSEIVSKEEAVAVPTQVSTTIKGPEPSASQQVPAVQQTNAPVEEEKVEEKLAEKPKPEVAPEVNPPAEVSALPVAVIIAKPTKGQSPLNVQFNAAKSYSPKGKIVSYVWDFGDGDISEKKNPTNAYYSATYGSRIFNVTLTVKDDKGQIGTTSLAVEVTNK
jgi:PKD repeat protein